MTIIILPEHIPKVQTELKLQEQKVKINWSVLRQK